MAGANPGNCHMYFNHNDNSRLSLKKCMAAFNASVFSEPGRKPAGKGGCQNPQDE